MKEPRNHLPSDLKALRYLDALNAGDLEAVAALWEEASRDPELERMLAELDDALFVEGAGASVIANAEHLRGLLTKHLPRGFPPLRPPARGRRWAVGVGAAGTLAAACLLAVVAWPPRDGKNPVASPGANLSVDPFVARPVDDSTSTSLWREARRGPDGAERPAFAWPIRNTLSVSIPPDLLD